MSSDYLASMVASAAFCAHCDGRPIGENFELRLRIGCEQGRESWLCLYHAQQMERRLRRYTTRPVWRPRGWSWKDVVRTCFSGLWCSKLLVKASPQEIPRLYGFAYEIGHTDMCVFYPIPFNIGARYCRLIWYALKRGIWRSAYEQEIALAREAGYKRGIAEAAQRVAMRETERQLAEQQDKPKLAEILGELEKGELR